MLDSYRSSFAHLNVAVYLFSGKYFDLENLLKFFFIIHHHLKGYCLIIYVFEKVP